MSGVTFDNGVASKYLTPTAWWQWLLTGKLEIKEKKAYLITWLGKTEFGKASWGAHKAKIEGTSLRLFGNSEDGGEIQSLVDLKAEYRWSKPGEFNGRNALLAFGVVAVMATFFFARKV